MSEENARTTLNWILETLKERQKEAETEMNKNTSGLLWQAERLPILKCLRLLKIELRY